MLGALLVAGPASAAEVKMVAAGDIACAPGGVPSRTSCQQEATAQAVEQINPSVVAPLGDVQYEVGSLAEFNGSFNLSWGRFKSKMRPAVGNHEYKTPGATGYFDYFGGQAGPRGKGWYSYEAGDWHVVVLNSQCSAVGCEPGSEQGRWLAADLAAHRSASCTLAYYHHGAFTGGDTAHDPNNLAARALFGQLNAARADLVLNGHDHSYQRFEPLRPDGGVDQALGLREIVVGTGGDDFHAFGPPAPNTAVRDNASFGVLELNLRATDYDWRFHPVAGATFTDAGSATCHRVPAKLRASVKRKPRGGALRAVVGSDRAVSLRGTARVSARTARRLGLGRHATTVAKGRGRVAAGASRTLKLRLTRRARVALRRTRRVKLSVRLTGTTAAGRTSAVTRRVTLR
jgi:hypothetical protein